MSLLTKGIGLAKKVKHGLQNQLKKRTRVYLSPVRRIERVKTREKVVAMTFDDGPCRLPPSQGGDKPLTLHLIETLEQYGAKGTFDVVGDTSGNYPDKPGKHGSASWGGLKYDHYPDIFKDKDGGAQNCPELIARMLTGGHEITSHTFAHLIYGWKPLVYGRRRFLGDIALVTDDLRKLHGLMQREHGYEIKLSRPPHYVDQIKGALSAYDALAAMDYQYLAASFDGAGWLPLSDYETEVRAMYLPLQRTLEGDPDALCGQIIFQKDGYNMARRTPVADGLARQLELLKRAGYTVVTVSELLSRSPFEDLGQGDDGFEDTKELLALGLCVAFRDNTVRMNQPVTRGELAMMVFGKQTAKDRVERLKKGGGAYFADVPAKHPYGAAIKAAADNRCFEAHGRFCPDARLTWDELTKFCEACFGKQVQMQTSQPLTRKAVFAVLAKLAQERKQAAGSPANQ